MDSQIENIYGHRVRVRVCGLCWEQENLLLINHHGLSDKQFWAPPGGGVEFGESLEGALRREFMEETGLTVTPGPFRFGCEYINKPLHAIELYFDVHQIGGLLKTGQDPELPIIRDVRFVNPADIAHIEGNQLHGIFKVARSAADFARLAGFYRI